MTSLIKKIFWLIIYLIPILALLYYRAFIFTAELNQPIDIFISDASETIGFQIPSYKLPSNEKSLYNRYIGDSDSNMQNQVSPYSQHQHAGSFNNYQNQPLPNRQSPVRDPRMQSQPAYMVEVESSAAVDDESSLNIDQIITAVKDTVTETLESLAEDNDQQGTTNESSMLNAQELLFKARLAYWNGDLKTAESTYIQLTELVSEDPNAYGELGNLYYMQSRWKKASDAYYHAALKLNKNNNKYQARHLLRIIRGLDTETADKLHAELNKAS